MEPSFKLRDCSFRPTYDSYVDNPVDDFLIPALISSSNYDRAVGYFSSALLGIVPEAFSDFAERGGRIRLICSPSLSIKDAGAFEALSLHESLTSLNHSIDSIEKDGLLKSPLDLMAKLIQIGCLSVKFAIPYDPNAGIFHQKIGTFRDVPGDFISFSGSNNESVAGWMEMRNAEAFSVYTSWRDENDAGRASDVVRRFEQMWNNTYPGFDILDFTKALSFIDRRSKEDIDLQSIKGNVREWYEDRKVNRIAKKGPSLYPYQKEVLEDWKSNSHKGIVCFATGAGKTYTALGAIAYWRKFSPNNSAVILVPSIRLQKQWRDEISSHPDFKDVNVLFVGGIGAGLSWRMGLSHMTSAVSHLRDGIVLAVMDSAATAAFLDRVKWGPHLLLVADEIHNLGAPGYVALLEKVNCDARLGLSATPNRYNDDENILVRQVFGRDLLPIVDIPYAQNLGVLVEYRYRYEKVELTDDETIKYAEITRQIGAEYGRSEGGPESDRLKLLKINRARILKNAANKIEVAGQLIRREYVKGDSWLVFCNDAEQLTELNELLKEFKPLTYHQQMQGDGDKTLELFKRDGGILLAIQMMDEGVDIPSIDHALLVASSQSTRQFIQRRGRVLRANRIKTKGVAEIWDLMVVNEKGYAFNGAEVSRAVEFGKMAINSGIIHDLKNLVESAHL